LDITALANGIYLVQIAGDGKLFNAKFIKNN
jgi:hypothetical protein